ncbi:MAG: plasmid mobilization protein [Ktedonobacterales bacterium]
MRIPRSSDELFQRLERQSDEDGMWTQNPASIQARPSRTSVLSLRLPTAEFHLLLKAARQAGVSVSEYVRKAIALRQELEPVLPTVNVTVTYTGMPDEAEPREWLSYTSGTPQPILTPTR